MSSRLVILFSAALLFLLSSCATTKHSEIVLAKYDDNKITMGDFENAYAKIAGGPEQAKKDSIDKLKNFLDLYVNFKMKLRDAYIRDYDDDSSLSAELKDYKEKVGVSYLLEKYLVNPAIKKLYERRKWEYRVSHIMFKPEPGKEQETKALADAVLDSIKKGASFEDMVQRYSIDPYSKPNGGDIYYVTAGQLPIEFEDAVYQTEPGQVYPEVVKTRFGLHIIKVTEKQPRVPEIRASHIVAAFRNVDGKIDTAAAKAKIDSVYEKVKAGEDFAELAKEYSDDPASKEKGGDLGYFQRRTMVKPFDEAVFNLKVGQISDIVETNYGFHIIKLVDKKPYPSFEEDKDNLKKIFEKQSYDIVHKNFVDSLRNKYNYQVNDSTENYFLSKSDSVKLDENHPALEELKNLPLFSYDGRSVSVGEFIGKVADKKNYYGKIISKNLLDEAIKAVSEDYVLDEAASGLDKTDSQFASLMDDYKNGIYIFKLQEDEVWNKIKTDSSSLYQYYLDTKSDYSWPLRVSFAEIYSSKDSLINYYYTLLQNGADFDSLAAAETERPLMKEKHGKYSLDSLGTNPLYKEAAKLQNPGDYSKPIENAGGYSILKLLEKDLPGPKTFEEARADVSGKYQESESKRLDQQYIERLKKRYEPVIYYSELEKAFKEGK
jgi:peptidyl-prolyl cis-trans isomerase SurA